MSSLAAATSSPADLLSTGRSGLAPSRPDESFWQDVFDRAETLGMDLAEAALPSETTAQNDRSPQDTDEVDSAVVTAPDSNSGISTNPSAISLMALASGNAFTPAEALAPQLSWGNRTSNPSAAARWQAGQGYGLAPADSLPMPPQGLPTQPPSAVNATWITLPNGELKLYLRAAGLSPSQAIEAAALPDLPQSPGQPPTISEVVLNGQTVYTRGADVAPSFILTC